MYEFLVLSFVVVAVGGMGSLRGQLRQVLAWYLQLYFNDETQILPVDQIIIYMVAVVILLIRPRSLLGRRD